MVEVVTILFIAIGVLFFVGWSATVGFASFFFDKRQGCVPVRNDKTGHEFWVKPETVRPGKIEGEQIGLCRLPPFGLREKTIVFEGGILWRRDSSGKVFLGLFPRNRVVADIVDETEDLRLELTRAQEDLEGVKNKNFELEHKSTGEVEESVDRIMTHIRNNLFIPNKNSQGGKIGKR